MFKITGECPWLPLHIITFSVTKADAFMDSVHLMALYSAKMSLQKADLVHSYSPQLTAGSLYGKSMHARKESIRHNQIEG